MPLSKDLDKIFSVPQPVEINDLICQVSGQIKDALER
jgi:hypothetical protein